MKKSLVLLISMACIVILNIQRTSGSENRRSIIAKSFVMGKTHFGRWTKATMCKNNGQVSGFRLRVEDDTKGSDDTALNGIQLMCKDGTVTPKIEGNYGKWKPWQLCGNKRNYGYSSYIDGFNFRSERWQHAGDDTAGNNVKMQCNNRKQLDGQGTKWGSWDHKGFQRCPANSLLCGVQARIEDKQHWKDDTGLNQIRFLCCKVKAIIAKSFVMGKTHFGRWTKATMCKNNGQVSGFRLRVEDNCHTCDDTALNGIQLMCKDGTVTPKIEGNYGKWKPWQLCGNKRNYGYSSYIDGFNFRSERWQHAGDDTAGNNVKMQCNNRKQLDGQGTKWGSWDHNGFQRCPPNSFLCGVQARIENKQHLKDDTGLNQIRFLCCKIKAVNFHSHHVAQEYHKVVYEKVYYKIPADEKKADAAGAKADADLPKADAATQNADATKA